MKTKLINVLSLFLVACAGTPPKMERPVKIYNGIPEQRAICRISKDAMVAFAEKNLENNRSKKEVKKNINNFVATPTESIQGVECIDTTDRDFSKYAALTFADLAVLIKFQEKLIFSCAKWKSGAQ